MENSTIGVGSRRGYFPHSQNIKKMYKKQVVFKMHFKPFICQFCPFAEQFGRIAWHRSLAVQIWRILGGWKLT